MAMGQVDGFRIPPRYPDRLDGQLLGHFAECKVHRIGDDGTRCVDQLIVLGFGFTGAAESAQLPSRRSWCCRLDQRCHVQGDRPA